MVTEENDHPLQVMSTSAYTSVDFTDCAVIFYHIYIIYWKKQNKQGC